MPGVIRHNPSAGDSISKTDFNAEAYHHVGGEASKIVQTVVLDTAANFASDDPVLDSGEMGIETDTGRSKIGNGVATWSELPYSNVNLPSGYEPFTTAEKAKLGAISDPQPEAFSLTAGCYLFDPADSTTYYWGSLQSRLPKTDPLYFKIGNPADYGIWISSVSVEAHAEGTLGTTETSSLYIRVNNTTDYLVTDQIKLDAVLSSYKVSGLNIPLTADDYFEFKLVTPAWVTNPTSVQFSATVYASSAGSATAPLAVSSLTATAVGDTIATLNGNLTGMGGESSIDVSFEWGLTDAYGSTTTPETKTSGGTFFANLTSLPTTTLHHFRAKATDGVTTVYGTDFTFTTGTTPPTPSLYGTMAYTGSDPIGGGAGYTGIITSGDYTVSGATNAARITSLKALLAGASPGEVVYVPHNIGDIDLTSEVVSDATAIIIPDGVTLASNRGYSGSLGALIYHTSMTLRYIRCFVVSGDDARITGLRLRGPDEWPRTSSDAPYMNCIESTGNTGLEVDNCEIYNWPYGGICWYSDGAAGSGGANFSSVDWGDALSAHHNYIHHCRRSGLGYGIQLGSSSAYIYANHFNACRHFIEGERDGDWDPEGDTGGSWDPAPTNGKEIYCKSHYNIFGYGISPEGNGTQFDMHGGSDTYLPSDRWGPFPAYQGKATCFAGGEIEVKWCDFKVPGQGVISIRGIPRYSWTVQWNWIASCSESQQSTYLKQRLWTIPGYSDGPPYVVNSGEEILVSDNWWGSTPPPEE